MNDLHIFLNNDFIKILSKVTQYVNGKLGRKVQALILYIETQHFKYIRKTKTYYLLADSTACGFRSA